MFKLIVLLVSFYTIGNMVLVDFNTKSDSSDWIVINDGVMGGKSEGQFDMSLEGHGVYSGNVSLENNGGFSSVRYRFDSKTVSTYNTIVLRLKGDGKRYQFRVKSTTSDRHSYIYYFKTTGNWQTLEIPLNSMVPKFRGRALDIPNYECETMEEIAFLIGNKKAEKFRLEIDKITLK